MEKSRGGDETKGVELIWKRPEWNRKCADQNRHGYELKRLERDKIRTDRRGKGNQLLCLEMEKKGEESK